MKPRTTSPPCRSLPTDIWLLSYEGLPPNFSLGANMLAGAFAGIAVFSTRPRY